MRVGIAGAGNWGRHLVRNFCEILGEENVLVSDIDEGRRKEAKERHPGITVTRDFECLLMDKGIEAVVIATPATTHFELAKKALLAGKHVLVEKPIALDLAEAVELVKLAEETDRTLMVDHLLEYHPAVEEMKRRIDAGELGEVYYLYSQRLNLGVVRTEENALWSLGPHDISVMLYLLGEEPVRVSAHGGVYLQREEGIDDVVFLSLEFNNGVRAHSHLSWLDPYKVRKITVIGSQKMMVFDDMEEKDKLKIFDSGVEKAGKNGFRLRRGEVHSPNIKPLEPLKAMCLHFLECITQGEKPRSDGYDGLRVLKVLDAAQRSLDGGGRPTIIANLEL